MRIYFLFLWLAALVCLWVLVFQPDAFTAGAAIYPSSSSLEGGMTSCGGTSCEPSAAGPNFFVCTFCPLYYFRGQFYAALEGHGNGVNVTIDFPFTGATKVVHDLSTAPATFDASKCILKGPPAALSLLHYRLGAEVYAHAIIDGLFPLFAIARRLLETNDAAKLSKRIQLVYLDQHNTVLGDKYNVWWEVLSTNPIVWPWDLSDTVGNVIPWAAFGHHYRGTVAGRGSDQRLWREFATFMAMRLLGYDPPQQSGLVVLLNRKMKPDSRAILNEWDATLALREAGIHVITAEPGTLTLAQQVFIGRSAQVFIGPHGSNLANLAFVHDRAALIEVQPDGMQSPWFQGFAHDVGVRYFTGYTWNESAYAAAAVAGGGAGSWSAFMRSMNCNTTHILKQVKAAEDEAYVPTCAVVVANRPICE